MSRELSRRALFGGPPGPAPAAVPPTASLGSAAAAGPLPLASPRGLDELETPALLIDLEAFEENLRKAALFLSQKGIGLRPHAKTHKCSIIALKQMEHGAMGVCAAKVSEAEVLVEAGIDNVLITSPVVTEEKIRRVLALAGKSTGLQMVVDNIKTARDFSQAAEALGVTLRVVVDLDTGTRRTGVAPGRPAFKLVEVIHELRALEFDGLQAYSGHVMHVEGYDARKRCSLASLAPCLETKARIERAGYEVRVFTGGGTGTFDIDCDVEGFTDLQLGSYIFMDAQYRAIGERAGGVFECFRPALFVLATAISQPVPGRITIDAGYKALAHEPECRPRFRDFDNVIYHFGGDEHGIVEFIGAGQPIELGDKRQLIVSHCDPTVNLYDYYHPYRNGKVEELWPVSARGCSR